MSRNRGHLIKLRILAIVMVALTLTVAKPKQKADAAFGGIAYCMWQYSTCQDGCRSRDCEYQLPGMCGTLQEYCLRIYCRDAFLDCLF